ncbi:MAG: aminopeptidase [Flavobacteriales bacterium]|nr:MAG: aminopeptidase [Flavobacteriales bacterium]
MKKSLFLVLILIGFNAISQSYDPLHPPSTFQSKDNPDYWKNRKPYDGYWQQDVHYNIKANIDEKTNIISGQEKLIYYNNSPHDLTHVFFHLYQNAFQPDAYYDNLQKNNKKKPHYGKYESEKKGTEIVKLTVNGEEVKTELDNTILKVMLPEALKSGESITFDVDFLTYFDGEGGVRRRMKTFQSYGSDRSDVRYRHYDGVHWYPRISVYDRKFGWTTDQHLGREFYGDFGTFDVELTFANHFVVEATGFLQNRDEVLPEDLRKKLDIKNFEQKPWGSRPSEIITYNSEVRKTWKYHAENVHDFAFTADPTYRIGEAKWNDYVCYSLAQEHHASLWQNAAEYAAKIIKIFSEDFGMYTYHKMIVADARDGMEYPMLTLDGGYDPGYRGLLVHEIGHNWFFGQIGNNETYRASLDEGFTQFLTAWGQSIIDGDTIITVPEKSWYKKKFRKPTIVRERVAYRRYLQDAIKGEAPPLNIHSDGFNGALRHGGGYRHVYYKTAVMLYNLQYVLGDELFYKAMKNYFAQWKICHPYFDDLRKSFVNYTKVDLNWFFDQWLETGKSIDYGIKSVKKGKGENEYIITFKRKKRMHMPLDFSVYTTDGKENKFYIPNTWFEKETNATVLPRWIGWDKVQPEYEAKITVEGKIEDVKIDPSGRLADVNKLDNNKKCPFSLKLDHQIYNAASQDEYELFFRPEVWFNGFDGLKAGVHLNGDYFDYLHKFDLTLWYNTGVMQQSFVNQSMQTGFDALSFRLNYSTPLDKLMKGSSTFINAKMLDGLYGYTLGLDKKFNGKNTRVYTYFKSMYRPNDASLTYLLYPDEWNVDKFNNTTNVGIDHRYGYVQGTGNINLNIKSSTFTNDYNYSSVTLEVINNNRLGKKLRLKTRTFAQYGLGTNWAPESQLYVAGANPEEMMENKYTRSQGFVDRTLLGYGATTNNFQMGGGLNLRGYAGYLVPQETDDSEIRMTYKGNSGASFSAELDFHKLINFNPRFLKNTFRLETYLFGDIGILNSNYYYEDLSFADFRADAGIGAALTIKKWGALEMVNPLTVRIDLPMFLNRIPATEDNYWDLRWVVGINRTF